MEHPHKRKLGQIETFGLAFIVILISVGFFMFVSYKSRQTPSNPQQEFTNDKLAGDFVLAIGSVTVQDCESFTVRELVVDCARDNRIKCGIGANEKSSCVAVNESITIMLNKTFMIRDTKFRFYSENLYDINGKTLINITYRNCTSNSRKGQGGVMVIPLHPDPRVVYLRMNICY
jgi:hypothetical protein